MSLLPSVYFFFFLFIQFSFILLFCCSCKQTNWILPSTVRSKNQFAVLSLTHWGILCCILSCYLFILLNELKYEKLQILNWFFFSSSLPSPIVLKCNCKVCSALYWHLLRVEGKELSLHCGTARMIFFY